MNFGRRRRVVGSVSEFSSEVSLCFNRPSSSMALFFKRPSSSWWGSFPLVRSSMSVDGNLGNVGVSRVSTPLPIIACDRTFPDTNGAAHSYYEANLPEDPRWTECFRSVVIDAYPSSTETGDNCAGAAAMRRARVSLSAACAKTAYRPSERGPTVR